VNFDAPDTPAIAKRSESYLATSFHKLHSLVDRMMLWLLAVEWLGMVGVSFIVSPRVWNGTRSGLHPHVWAAILAGPAFILPAIGIAFLYPARRWTRHVIAVAQILVSVLLIDCTGGRIETHFHVFGSLAFLAFYRDWTVLATATVVTAVDHIVRGIWWPQSVYGVMTVSPWRWVEHAWWVLFEDFFLLLATRDSIRDMRAMAISKARLYYGACHDVLTGLANRRLLQDRFDSWAGSAAGKSDTEKTSALLFIDLDRFKQANDTLGHTVGDRLLKKVAARLGDAVSSEATLARIGGDEFVVFLPHCDGAEALGKRLVDTLASPFHINGHELLLSASVGISLFPEHGTTLAALQERADRAMYVAKSQGRNCCVQFSTEVARREEIVQEISRDLSLALSLGQFQLHYQPLIHRDGLLTGFEALVRWNHPVHGLVAPAEFIPQAEQSGLILSLGDWILRQACSTCRTWQTPGQPGVGVAVNVSARQFDQADYSERVLDALEETGLDPSLLTLELTEGVLVRDVNRTRTHLATLRLTGIRIALDDFGTGYSSLSYLTDLPADVIKLDRSFLNRELPESSTVVESIVNLAHRLGLKVVAEGVETDTQRTNLLDLMCDQLQGYYFSKPVSEGEVPRLLEERSSVSGRVRELATV
jgi:diguanylate cyclase (GGDEF)-like protein